ncbi:tyrosine-type recombinase/integrase [Aeromonas caviae]|nr:site-specific integrase [Aeromonas caviae]MDX7598215.1 site-specific integrase [Aeromonas caviae]MDX7803079.1 site-specific integrase [Aeromonas caviae]MDY7800220.1 site-specific integrase [Aeromonas caviae]MDY7892699.1 site-specific integrase [Aeromonas caviae]
MIRQRGSSWQVDVTVDGKRIRKSVRTYAEAHELELKLEGSNKIIKPIINQRPKVKVENRKVTFIDYQPTMKDMLELTWRRSWIHRKTGSELKRRSLHVLVQMGWLDLIPAEISKKHFLQLIDFYRLEGNSLATINRKIVSITKLLGTAIDEELIHFKPSVHLFRECNARTRFLTCMEEDALLYWLRELGFDESWHLTRFLIDTGCRFGESMSIQPHSINRKMKSVLFEKTKNSMPRKIPLTARALESVLKWSDLNYQTFYKQFTLARRHAKLGIDVTPHTLRHTCASRLAQSGVPMAIIKAWLGHRSIRMTDRYAHLNDSNLIEARDVLNHFNDK